MSTRKQSLHKRPETTAAELRDDNLVPPPAGGLENLEVTSLELDQQFEVDTDPYNRTGSHFVAALRRKDD